MPRMGDSAMGSRDGPRVLCRLAAGVLTLAVAACTGTGHKLPVFSATQHQSALQEIAAAPGLRPATRTSAENERLARETLARPQSAAQPICRQVQRDKCWYSLTYERSPKVNAGILQNRMVFYDGLAQYLDNEHEFAAIIGHEIGHHLSFHYEEDAQNRAIGAAIAGILMGGLAAATGAYQYNPSGLQNDLSSAMRLGAQIGDISFSKEQEREADYLATYLMARAGYDPDAAASLWIKLAKISGRTRTGLLDSHPASSDRLAAWRVATDEVRYSTDLMPNPKGAGNERPRQVARVFGGGDGGSPKVAVAEAGPDLSALEAEKAPRQAFTAERPAADSDPAPAPSDAAAADAESEAAGLRYAATGSWDGLFGAFAGTMSVDPGDGQSGGLVLTLSPEGATDRVACEGRWTAERHGTLTLGTLSLDCGDGRTAEGRYRVTGTGDGLAGLEDEHGNFVELRFAHT